MSGLSLAFSQYMPVQLLSGKDVLIKNSSRFQTLGKRCLIVTGANSAKASGALDDIERILNEAQISYTIYDKIKPNPLVSDCQEAGELARKFGADFVVGIGGGSPLDSAKVIALLASCPLSEAELYSLNWPKRPLPTVLIGTTAGTGSEVTMVSVLTNHLGQKKSVTAPALYPVLSFADPRYTASCGYETTLSCGLDALCHGIEGYFSVRGDFLTDIIGKEVIPLLLLALEKLAGNPEYRQGGSAIPMELREDLYYGSLLAGLILNHCGAGFPHTMSYVLTEEYHIPHGRACAIYLPEYLRRAAQYRPDKWEKLGLSLPEIIQKVEKLNPLPEIRMTSQKIEGLLARYEGNKNFKNSPGQPDENTAKGLMKKLWGDGK